MSDDPQHRSALVKDAAAAVCLGNAAALQCCDIWFDYCHGIDDVFDTRVDGRPTMTNAQLMKIFWAAAMLYNCEFYVAHQKQLFPIVIMVTNAYADVVDWERAPEERRRKIADVLRCCGNEFFFAVAMIVGGLNHMRAVSPRIRETSWTLQHDENGDPN